MAVPPLDTHSALIYLMVILAASDGEMTDAELHTIGENVRYLPVFSTFDVNTLPGVSQNCAAALNAEGGVAKTLIEIAASIPVPLRETAYALAVEVTVADNNPSDHAVAVLETVRTSLHVSALAAAAIHHAARARHLA
jgi:tellurite resistance protein